MLNLKDIIGMCDCTEEEIAAVAMNEHVPDAVASVLADYLIHSEDGVPKIRRIIIEDIEMAKAHGHDDQVEKLKYVLKHFIATHPEYQGSVNAE
jgi:hypothetical protein